MYNNKFLTIISTLFIIICFSINTYAITEKQYLIINDLIEQENIDKAFEDLKIFQKGTGKLTARNQILIGKIYLALEQPAKAFTFFEKAIFTLLPVGNGFLKLNQIALCCIESFSNNSSKCFSLIIFLFFRTTLFEENIG